MSSEQPSCRTCGYPLASGEHSDECKQHTQAREEIIKRTRAGLERLFGQNLEPVAIREILRTELQKKLTSELTMTLTQESFRQQLLEAFDHLDLSEPETAIDAILSTIDPLTELMATHGKEYEDFDAREIMETQGFIPVNERLSYSLSQDGRLQLHLAPSFHRKDQIEDLYRDALYKVADVVKNDPSIKVIGGWSWLNATKTYSAMKERLGFTISDIPPEDLEGYSSTDLRAKKNALMTREAFLKRYGLDPSPT